MIGRLMALLALFCAVPAWAQSDARPAIEAAMTDSAAGWNAGDVDRFLAVYSDDPATSFTTAKGVEHGKPGIRARYLKSYAAQFGPDAKARNVLTFTFTELRPLGADHALLIARWTLTARDGKAESGMTSLIFRKEAAGWRIIADHSS